MVLNATYAVELLKLVNGIGKIYIYTYVMCADFRQLGKVQNLLKIQT